MKNPVGRPKLGLPMSITLTMEQRLWLQDRADQTGATPSAIVRKTIDALIATEPETDSVARRKRVAKMMREIRKGE